MVTGGRTAPAWYKQTGRVPDGAAAAKVALTLCSDGHQLDSLAGDEVQSFVDVGDLVDSHLSSLRFGQAFACTHHNIRKLACAASVRANGS